MESTRLKGEMGNLSFSSKRTVSSFMEVTIAGLKSSGRVRTSETYMATFSSFMKFMKGRDIMLSDVDSDLMLAYEAYLKEQGVSSNTISFYMRIMRAMYNSAVEKGITKQRYPFKHVYTGTEKTVKRAVSAKIIKQIKELNLRKGSSLEFARDMFLFSFYTRGMSFVDMAYLKKEDLDNGVLTYRRKKTGQLLSIKWEECMQEIVDRHSMKYSPYMLPILSPRGKKAEDERRTYKNASCQVNRRLKEIGRRLDLSHDLTMYVARHSWASIAKKKNIPVSVISEGMGHDSEKTTLIYLSSLDATVIDHANSVVLNEL